MPEDELNHYGKKGMKWGKRAAKAVHLKVGKAAVKYQNLTPKQKKNLHSAVIASAILAKAYGPMVMNLGMDALGSAAVKRASARGAASAADTLLSVGANRTASLSRGSDGVWRL